MNFPKPTTKQELFADLQAIDNYYKPLADEFEYPDFLIPSFTKMTHTSKTHAALMNDANIIASKKCDAEKKEWTVNLQAKITANRTERAANEKKRSVKLSELDSEKEKELAAVNTSLSGKGIAVSTVADSMKNEISEKYERLKILANAEYDVIKGKFDAEYAELNSLLESADELFEAKLLYYANDICNKLQDKDDEEAKNVLKYNNEIEEREKSFKNTWAQANARLKISVNGASTAGMTVEKLEALGFYDDKLAVIKAFYSNFTATTAYNDFNNTPEFVHHLGKYYYETLYNMYRLSKLSQS